MTVFSRLIPTVTSAYALQTLFAMIFVPQENDKYYDLGGAVGWLSTTFISLYYPALRARFWEGRAVSLPGITTFAPRQLLLTAAVGIWSVRLGTYLTQRAMKTGGDSRFDEVKKQPALFSTYWFVQATWITLVGLPIFMCNTLPSSLVPALGMRDYAAVGLYAGSLIFEVVADAQKSTWRKAKDAKQHDEQFISSGLWGISRHPNYVGEVGIWTGIWALSAAALQTASFPRGTLAVAAISPLFTWFLVRNVSGVPPLEKSGDKKYGGIPEWQKYKRL